MTADTLHASRNSSIHHPGNDAASKKKYKNSHGARGEGRMKKNAALN